MAVTVLLTVAGDPAGADPATPTNFVSRLLTPATLDGATVKILGGDAFVSLSVEPGHEAVVPDYSGDEADRPYLRFLPDGTVQVNEHSAAAAANESRFGSSPADFDPDRAPRWHTVAHGGSYAWHDHRIHLMVPDDMAVVDARGRVDLGGDDGTWEVPIRVDGVETVLRGELVRLDGPSPWPWYGAAVVAFLAVVGLALTPRVPGWILTVVLLVLAGAATAVSVTELGRAPEGSGASVVPSAVAASAVLGAVVAAAGPLAGRRAGAVTRAGIAAAAAMVLWWGVVRVDVFAHAFLPSGVGGLDRAVTAGTLGCGLAAALVLVWRPALLTTRR